MKAWKKGSVLLAAFLLTLLFSCCGAREPIRWEPVHGTTRAESTAATEKGSEGTEPVKTIPASTAAPTRTAPTETSAAETVERMIPATTTESVPETETGEPKLTYIANTSSKKFHYPDCSSVSDMKESNKLYFTGTREELIEQGYQPCKRCKP